MNTYKYGTVEGELLPAYFITLTQEMDGGISECI
ncbi:hypothetical protein ACVIJU_000659 [Aeribacillus sp. SP014]